MSASNVEIVRRVYAALARNEFPATLLDPDVEYVNPAGAVEPGVRRGIGAFTDAVQAVLDGWQSFRMEPERFTAVGDQVAVVLSYEARGPSSGVEVHGRESALFTLHEGKIVRYEWFHEPDEAHDAAMRRA